MCSKLILITKWTEKAFKYYNSVQLCWMIFPKIKKGSLLNTEFTGRTQASQNNTQKFS